MTALNLSNHAEIRMNQRGIRQSDIDLIMNFGEQIAPDAIMMTKRRALNLIEDFKSKIHAIERLTNKKLIIEDGKIITAYHSAKTQQRKDLRRARG